ncbi:MAG: heavy metal translocating P-type ATPase [Bifidobacteriaceae bacterium]|jgi:heavy metal translocating P-type ATPase|nr:heavy metal translocating P-type ATPase [Bifidobacteriaceae bacterium]MCI1978354.1 heavy metal translocating P-type ATPase [Bifidobacteriaceae bacterium]
MAEATEQTHQRTRRIFASIGRFILHSPKPFIVLIIGGVCGVLWSGQQQVAIWIFLALTAYAVIDALLGIIQDIRHGHVGVDLLAIIAILATTAVGEHWAAWIVVLMIYSGDTIESFAQSRASRNLTALMDAAPQIAHVLHESGGPNRTAHLQQKPSPAARPDAEYFSTRTGERVDYSEDRLVETTAISSADLPSDDHSGGWDTVDVDAVRIGDRLVVKPGETVPVNGVLLSDTATIDLSMISGEPVPVDMYRGGRISSGAINGATALTLQATATAASSQYQKILQLVKNAQDSRAAVVKTADMLAVPFTVVSLIIAFLAWYLSGDPLRFAQVLVLATPCPLLIAAPVAYLGGTGRLAKIGVIIKTQDVLESLGNVSHIFFDKTGTLTRKRPEVARIDLLENAKKTYTDEEVLRLAGPLEAYSVHILAKGISTASTTLLRKKGLPRPHVEDASEEPGNGTSGTVDGHDVKVGRLAFVEPGVTHPADLFTPLAPNEMVAFVSIDGTLVGRIILTDFARPNSATAVRALRKIGVQRLSMLTGDNYDSAAAIGNEVGISDIKAQLLPEEKVEALKAARHDPLDQPSKILRFLRKLAAVPDPAPVTMMVGDGVNDAPVLASATIGVAMTDGSVTAASESAHVVIMNDDIEMVPAAILISRQTKRTMLQAVLVGLGTATVLMILAACNLIPVVVGAFLQELIDVMSILWALTAIIDHKK